MLTANIAYSASTNKSTEAKPIQAKPTQAKPIQAKPTQAKPTQVRSITNQEPIDVLPGNRGSTVSTQSNAEEKIEWHDAALTLANYDFRLMGEFGLGNIASVYGVYKLFYIIYMGLGVGYSFYSDDATDTSIQIIEPSLVIIYPIDFFLIRVRAGQAFAFEKKYGLKASTTVISPDILLKLRFQNIYIGVGLPIIIGKEGTGVAFSIGAGYTLIF